jgi:hypothetical protein
MKVKLTLRFEEALIRRAEAEASRRGMSLSQMVSEYFNSITRSNVLTGGYTACYRFIVRHSEGAFGG